MFEEFDSKKLISVVMMLLVIGILTPIILTVQQRLNNELITQYVYVPVEVNNNNITIASNFTTNVDIKEVQQSNISIVESYNNLNQSSILNYTTNTNLSSNIAFSIENVTLNDYTGYEISNIINDPTGSSSYDANNFASGNQFLYQSFRVNQTSLLKNISVYGFETNTDVLMIDIYTSNNLYQPYLNLGKYGEITFTVDDFKKEIIENESYTINPALTFDNTFFVKLYNPSNGYFICHTTNTTTIDYVYDVYGTLNLMNLDFTINYTLQSTPNELMNISINNVIFDANTTNIYEINNFQLNYTYLDFVFNWNWTNVTFDIDISLVIFSPFFNTTINNISINQIMLYSTTAKVVAFNANNSNIVYLSNFQQNITKLLLFSSATNRYIDVTLPATIGLSINKQYNFKIKAIEVFVDSFKLELDVYENNVLKNSYNVTTATLYPVYAF